MLSLKCKINGVPLTWKLYKHQIWIYFVPISTEETLTPYFTSVHTPLKVAAYFYDSLFPCLVMNCVNTLCYWKRLQITLPPNHSLLLSFLLRSSMFPESFFTFLIICWCNDSIFNKSLLECADALTHRKRTWLRTFWRLTLALLLCSSVSLMKWESRMRIAWCRDCSSGELWEIDSQTVWDWIRLLRNSWRSHLHYETALVNNHKVIRRRIWALLT